MECRQSLKEIFGASFVKINTKIRKFTVFNSNQLWNWNARLISAFQYERLNIIYTER